MPILFEKFVFFCLQCMDGIVSCIMPSDPLQYDCISSCECRNTCCVVSKHADMLVCLYFAYFNNYENGLNSKCFLFRMCAGQKSTKPIQLRRPISLAGCLGTAGNAVVYDACDISVISISLYTCMCIYANVMYACVQVCVCMCV